MTDNPYLTAQAAAPADGELPNPYIQPAVQAVRVAATTSPEQAASDQQIARQMGWPTAAVSSAPKDARAAATALSVPAAVAGAPATAKWISDLDNASVAHDHVPVLAGIERSLKNAFYGLNAGLDQGEATALQGSAAALDNVGRIVYGAPAPGQLTFGQLAAPGVANLKGWATKDAAPIVAPGAGTAVATTLGNLLPALVAPVAAPAYFGAQGAGEYDAARQAKGIAPSRAQAAIGLAAGAGQAALAALPVGELAEGFVPSVAKAATEGAGKLVQATRVAATGAAKLGAGTAASAAVGAGMQLVNNAAVKLGIDPTQNLGAGVLDSAGQMALLHVIARAPGLIADTARDTGAALTGATSAQSFNDAAQGVRDAPLTQRAPDRLQALVNGIAPDGKVYLPADSVRSYNQADGDMTPFIRAGVADQVQSAMATGADLVVPADDYLTHIAPTAAHEALKDDLRTSPDGMSVNEASGFAQHYDEMLVSRGDDLASEAKESSQAAEPMQRVYADIQSQAREAGYSVDVAKQYAALYAARYETRASRLNEPNTDLPEGLQTDAWREYQRAGAGGGVGLALDLPDAIQSHFDRLDTVIHALRQEKNPSAPKGDSLLDYVSKNGGLSDQGGEFSALDADKWHAPRENGGVRFRRKLIRSDGLSNDEMAERAQSAGYFPDIAEAGMEGSDNLHVVTGQHLIDAAREELAGKPRYANPIDHQRADFREATDQLDRFLSERGVDVAKTSNADIKRMLQAHVGSDPGATAYQQQGRPALAPDEASHKLQAAGVGGVTVKADSPLGPVLEGLQDRWSDAVKALETLQSGDAHGVLSHPDVPQPIDLVWGAPSQFDEAGHLQVEGFGLAKIEQLHPEIVSDLPQRLATMKAFAVSRNRIQLRGEDSRAVVRLDFDGQAKAWLLTAFGDEGQGGSGRTETTTLDGQDRSPDQLAGGDVASKGSPEQNAATKTNTPAFRRWFGESKVVDAEGHPLVVYHGTADDIEAFDTEKRGSNTRDADASRAFFFTDKPGIASQYADGATPDGEGPNVLPTYLSLQRPLIVDHAGADYDPERFTTYLDQAESGGHDGLIIRNVDDGMHRGSEQSDIYAAFKPEQIKSVFNRGGFDPSDARILHQSAPAGDFSRRLSDQIAEQHPGVKFELSDNGATATLSRLEVPVDERGRGVASAIMSDLTKSADTAGVRLALTPDGAFGGSVLRLRDFYKRFGFTENRGRDRSFTTRETMTRNPPGRSYDQSARGRIEFGEGPAIIRLFEGRDLSTLLHETGHLWLEEVRADAAREDAPEQLKRDWATTAQAIGLDPEHRGPIPTDSHETFARMTERYFMEGKAPSEDLRGPFQRFKGWLLAIYRQVTALKAPLSEEMRDVFDRMLATDSEIAVARDRAGLKIADPKALGMSDAEAGAYRNLAEKATGDAHDQLLSKLMDEVRRKRTKEWNEERDRTRGDAEEALSVTPTFAALERLTGRGDRVKLNARDVADIYGSDTVLDQLPRSVPAIYAKEGGVHPDELANATGFSSGEAMLNELMRLEAERRERAASKDTRSIRRFMVDQETDRLMADRHGDMLTDGSIQEEALAALHGERSGQLLAYELRALGRKTGQEMTPLKLVERWASEYIADRRYADLQPAIYLRAERKAAGEFEKALLAGHDDAALAAKGRQLNAHLLYREAQRARDASDVITRRMGRYADRATLKSMDQDHLDRIHQLLARFDFRPTTRKELKRRESFEAWALQRMNDGEVIVGSPETFSDAFSKHYSDMTVSELQGVADIVDSVAHLGRLKKKLLVNKEQRDFEAMLDEVEDRTAGLHDVPRERTAADHETKNRVREFDMSHLGVETLVDWLDGKPNGKRDVNGPLNRMLIRPGQDAQLEANNLRDQVLKPIAEAYDAVPWKVRRTWRNRIDAPELTDPATKAAMIMDRRHMLGMMLNLGSESNLHKLLDGYGWTEADVMAVINRNATKEEWDWVRANFKAVDSLWPRIAETERKLTGVVPEKVEARTIQTPFGDVEGGYWPAVYDPTRTPELDRARGQDATDLFNRLHVTAATSKGHTISRTEYTGPLLLQPDAVLMKHVKEVTTRLAYGEWLQSAKRLIESDRFRKVAENKIGPEAYQQFMPWLQRQVGYRLVDPRSIDAVDKFWRQVRTNATTSTAAVNPTVWFEHASAFPQSIAVLGWRNFSEGFLSYLSHAGPFASAQYIYGKSEMMRQRFDETTRDQRDMLDNLRARRGLSQVVQDKTGLPVGWMASIPEIAHFPVSWINQHIVAFPTWLGGYHGGLRDGLSEEDAIAAGDKAVRISHSSGAPMNLSAIQDGNNEFAKLATMFYAFRNTQYQLQRSLVWDATHAKSAGDVGRVMQTGMLLLLTVPIISAMVKGKLREAHNPLDVAEILADECLRNLWGGIAYGRDLANFGLNEIEGKRADYELSPITRSLTETGQALLDAGSMARNAMGDQSVKPSDRWLENMISAPGTFTGYPLMPAGRAAQYAKDVSDGKEQPSGPLGYAAGLAFGPPSTKH